MRRSGLSSRPEQEGIWISYYYSALPVPIPVSAILAGALLFGVGWLLSTPLGFADVYLVSTPVYLAALGFGLATGTVYWCLVSFRRSLVRARPCFELEESEYQAHVKAWLGLVSARRYSLAATALGVAAAWLAGILAVVNHDAFTALGIPTLRPVLFPPDWFAGESGPVLLMYFATLCGGTVGVGIWVLGSTVAFALTLPKLPVVPLPGLLRIKLRSLASVYLTASLLWSVGVLLVAILLVRDNDPAAFGVVIVMSALGFVIFWSPQSALHSCVLHAHEALADQALVVYRTRRSRPHTGAVREMELLGVAAFAGDPRETWVLDLRDGLVLVVGETLPFIVLILKGVL